MNLPQMKLASSVYITEKDGDGLFEDAHWLLILSCLGTMVHKLKRRNGRNNTYRYIVKEFKKENNRHLVPPQQVNLIRTFRGIDEVTKIQVTYFIALIGFNDFEEFENLSPPKSVRLEFLKPQPTNRHSWTQPLHSLVFKSPPMATIRGGKASNRTN
ncbi:hypothetical protein Cgig2_014857 [Carnegiea gigantea]|uniref:Uncharacterized protein n=1 Tax=Carnegiea gigantea TaxID=171969 RepID=A0A9Q1L0J2_9CARY|nr:hypothetical protein Cgig2_014857 [Carnegiea gigantea]